VATPQLFLFYSTNALPLLQNFTMQAKLDRVIRPISSIPPHQEVWVRYGGSRTLCDHPTLLRKTPPQKAMSSNERWWGSLGKKCESVLFSADSQQL